MKKTLYYAKKIFVQYFKFTVPYQYSAEVIDLDSMVFSSLSPRQPSPTRTRRRVTTDSKFEERDMMVSLLLLLGGESCIGTLSLLA